MISRRVTVAIIVVVFLALALATWGGTQLARNQAQKAGTEVKTPGVTTDPVIISYENQLTQMRSQASTLEQDNATIRDQLSTAMTELSKSQTAYGSMQQDNSALRQQLASAQGEVSATQSRLNAAQADTISAQAQLSALQNSLMGLQQDAGAVRSQLAALQMSYDALTIRYGSLERTKQFTVSEKLQVRLSTESDLLPGTAWVRGEAVNTSSTVIPKLYILIARYKLDGTLDKLDMPPSVILNLAPGASGYFSFLSGGDSCKITVIGDYLILDSLIISRI